MTLFFIAMKKYLPLLVLPFLVSCGGQPEVTEIKESLPSYCIRDVKFLDDEPGGRVLLDMPGWPYGATDKYQEIDRHTFNELGVPVCQSDDPRMSLQPSGIAWTDGRDTDLDGNPLTK